MTPHAWSLTFGLTALLAAVVIAVWCICEATRQGEFS